MNLISSLLGQVLEFIYNLVNNYGLAIVLFTVVVKTILLPLTIKQTKSMKAMQDIQPKVQEIQNKYKDKPEKQNQEIMKLYQEATINPMAGCLPLLIQFPILIGLYNVLRQPVKYGVFANEAARAAADTGFLWIPSLSAPDKTLILAVLAGVTTFITQKLTMPKDQQQGSMKFMTYFMSIMMFWWGISFPAGLTLYWTVSNLYQLAQQYLVMNPLKAKMANSGEGVINESNPRNKK